MMAEAGEQNAGNWSDTSAQTGGATHVLITVAAYAVVERLRGQRDDLTLA